MAILFDLGVNYPAGVGQKLERHFGLNDGSLLLYDFAIPDCIAPDATDIATAVNLADDKCVALTGVSPIVRRRAGQTTALTERTAGRGFRLLNSAGNMGVSIGRSNSTDARPVGFDEYLYAGGVEEDQHDFLIMHYFRCEHYGSNYNLAAYSASTFSNALFHINVRDGELRAMSITVSPLSGLMQIARSKDALFFNGRKVASLPVANYNAALNTLAPSNSVRMQMVWDGVAATPTQTIYRHVMEDLTVSGRDAAKAVADDWDYVRNFAPYYAAA